MSKSFTSIAALAAAQGWKIFDENPYPGNGEHKVIATGTSHGVEWWITSGVVPCIYLATPELVEDYDEVQLQVHGGLTFGGYNQLLDRNVIGWDYGHYTDYNPFCPDMNGKYWGIGRLIKEAVIAANDYSKILFQKEEK